jgi:hypothetical protein
VRSPALPTVDLAALARTVRRTLLVRAALVLAMAVALAVGVSSARAPEVRSIDLLPSGTSGVVVLDASASVEGSSRIADLLPDLYESPARRIDAALGALMERDEPVGLVLFSDVAYELLPPRSPAHALAPVRRFFGRAPEATEAVGRPPLENPWTQSFSGGTQVSTGLAEALEILERDGIANGSILLLSDLDAPDDRELGRVLERIRDSGVALRIVALADDQDREQLYARALGDGVFVDADELERPSPGTARPEAESARAASFPGAVVLAGAALLLLLALHERLLVRLPMPRRET